MSVSDYDYNAIVLYALSLKYVVNKRYEQRFNYILREVSFLIVMETIFLIQLSGTKSETTFDHYKHEQG